MIGDRRESFVSAAADCCFHEHAPGYENCYRTKVDAATRFSDEEEIDDEPVFLSRTVSRHEG
jgi:hypothetical protein